MTPAELHNYIFTNLVCGCGDPLAVVLRIRDILQALRDRSTEAPKSAVAYGEVSQRIHELLGHASGLKEPLYWWAWYALDNLGLIEHGSNIEGSWLTDKGSELLAALTTSDIEKLVEAEHVEDPAPRHLMAVPVSFVLLTEIVRQGYQSQPFECVDGIPPDAVLVSSFVNTDPSGAQSAHLVFEHESFPLVEAGMMPSAKIIVFDRIVADDLASVLEN